MTPPPRCRSNLLLLLLAAAGAFPPPSGDAIIYDSTHATINTLTIPSQSPTSPHSTEKDVQQWMESVLAEPFPAELTFAQALKDGQVGGMCVYMWINGG